MFILRLLAAVGLLGMTNAYAADAAAAAFPG